MCLNTYLHTSILTHISFANHANMCSDIARLICVHIFNKNPYAETLLAFASSNESEPD